MSNSVKLTFRYSNTDDTRVYQLDNVSDSALASVKSKVLALNARLAPLEDPDGAFSDDEVNIWQTFVTDDHEPGTQYHNSVGYFVGISKAEVVTVRETKIPLF